MTPITEDYVSFETAKLLKEKGFNDELCHMWYNIRKDVGYYVSSVGVKNHLPAPTLQMAMKWLREMYNIFIVIEPHLYDYVNERNASYVCSIWVGDNYYENLTSTDFPSYEEAIEAALKYSLKNLI